MEPPGAYEGKTMTKPLYISFTTLTGADTTIEVASIIEVTRLPAMAEYELPERTSVGVRGGSRYVTSLPVSEFDKVIKPVRVGAPFGYLCMYATGATIRPATESERAESIAAAAHDGGAGVFLVDGESCYVS